MSKTRGFTLIELVITVAIVGLLATVALPLVELTVKRAKEQELKAALREIRTGIDAYKLAAEQGRIDREADTSGYPPSLDVLVAGVEDITNPEKAKIYFMRRLPRDPFFPMDRCPRAQLGDCAVSPVLPRSHSQGMTFMTCTR